MSTTRTFSLDVDTKRYVNRVNSYRKLNGLNPLLIEDVVDIDNFIVGLKDLNLWPQVICWSFRSKYNIGIGSSVPSFGGKYYKECTLISSTSTLPSWGNRGVSITATNQGITTNLNQGIHFGINGFYSSVFFINNTTNEGFRIITCDFPATGLGFGVDDFDATNLRWLNNGGSGSIPKTLLTTFKFLSFGKGAAPNGNKAFLGNTIYGINTSNQPILLPTNNINIGGRDLNSPISSKLQTNAFFMISARHLSFSEHQSIYSLLKISICKDLELP